MKLPFKITPKAYEIVSVGDEVVGVIELAKKNGLTVAEELFIKSYMKEYGDLQLEAIEVARRIAAATGQTLFEVYDALNSGNTEVLGDHLGELIKLQTRSEEVSRQRMIATVTAIIRFRLDKTFTVDDTVELAPALIDAIYEFANNEMAGWVKVEPEPITEEQLDKIAEGIAEGNEK